jgi:competence protein ComEC
MLGILVGELRGPGSAPLVLVAVVIAAGVAVFVRGVTVTIVAMVVACALLGVASMQRALDGFAHSPITQAVAHRDDVTARGTLVDDPDSSRWSASALVKLSTWSPVDGHGTDVTEVTHVALPDRDAGGRRVLADASGDAASRLALLSAGEGILMRGWLAPLDGFDARAKWKHAVATLHVTEVIAVEQAHSPLLRLANRARTVVMSGTSSLAPTDRAVVSGFLLGDTRAVPERITEQFRAAGLTHLTAVSGGNIAFVLALVAPLLRRLRLGGRAAAAAAVMVVFGTMTRWEPSVARAIAMASIALLAGYLGRPTSALRALFLAAALLLLIDPFLLHSVGFVLSCTASLGIGLWSKRFTERLPGPLWIREILGVTAAAQLGVAPVLIPVFGAVPLVSLPANLFAVPLAAPLTMWGIVAGVISAVVEPIAPSATDVLAIPTTAMVHGLLAIADAAARVPVEIDSHAVWLVAAVTALGVAARRTRRLQHGASLRR